MDVQEFVLEVLIMLVVIFIVIVIATKGKVLGLDKSNLFGSYYDLNEIVVPKEKVNGECIIEGSSAVIKANMQIKLKKSDNMKVVAVMNYNGTVIHANSEPIEFTKDDKEDYKNVALEFSVSYEIARGYRAHAQITFWRNPDCVKTFNERYTQLISECGAGYLGSVDLALPIKYESEGDKKYVSVIWKNIKNAYSDRIDLGGKERNLVITLTGINTINPEHPFDFNDIKASFSIGGDGVNEYIELYSRDRWHQTINIGDKKLHIDLINYNAQDPVSVDVRITSILDEIINSGIAEKCVDASNNNVEECE